MSYKFEVKSNATATEGRTFSGTINGEKKTVNDIRYSINVPTFPTLQDFCEEAAQLSDAAKVNLLSLVTVALNNSYCNKATEYVARDIQIEDWTLDQFFQLTGNREGVSKAIEMAEEALITLASEKMEVLAGLNNILSDVISGKIAMADAPAIQQGLQGKVAEIDAEIKEVQERLQKLEVVKEEQAAKNKIRGLAAAESRKANKEKKEGEVVTTELSAKG